MSLRRTLPILALAGAAVALTACATFQRGPVGNTAVPQPAQAVDLNRYAGLWYEKVSFFGPFYVGDYWVLARAEDYSWSIVGEPSGRYLWLLSRTPHPSPDVRDAILRRTRELGYDLSMVRETRQP